MAQVHFLQIVGGAISRHDEATDSLRIPSLGIGTDAPASGLSISGGSFIVSGIAAPAASGAGTGKIYFDSTANKFKVSENTGGYVDLVGGGAGTVTASGPPSSGQVSYWTSATDVTGNAGFTFAASPTSGSGLAITASTVSSGNLVIITASGTAAASNTKTALNVSTSGANGTSTQTTYSAQIINTSTGTSSTNIAGYFSASGGTNNYGLIVANGNTGLGTLTPGSTLDVKGTLRLSGATSGYVGLAPAATAGSTTYTLPSADGTNGQILKTNGSGVLDWTSGNALSSTQSANLTGSRAVNGVYQNTTGKPLFVAITGYVTNGPKAMLLLCDSFSPPTTEVSAQSQETGMRMNIEYIVPPNFYFKISPEVGANLILVTWFENTLDGGSTPLAATIAYQTPWIGTPTAARALATTYRNETGKPLWVQIWGTHASATDHNLWAGPDSSLVTAQDASTQWADIEAADGTLTAVIPVGWYYRKSGGTSITKWVEWSLEGGGGAGGVPAGGSYGVSQSANLSSLRALGTVYQNTTGKPMFLNVSALSVGSSATMRLYCDSATSPTTEVSWLSLPVAAAAGYLTHMIPPGFYYKAAITFGTATLTYWFESSIDGTPLGATQSVNMGSFGSGSRVVASVYQNTTGKPMIVQVVAQAGGTSSNAFHAYSDASSSPTTVTMSGSVAAGGNVPLTFLVPPNHYYKIQAGVGTIAGTNWFETTLDGGGASSLLAGTMGMTNNDVSASRVTETVYQNTTGKAMIVQVNRSINASTPGGQGKIFRAYVGPTGSPTTEIASFHGLATWPGTLSFSVPQSHYYKIADSDLALPSVSIEWIETTIDGAPLGATQSANLGSASRFASTNYQNTTGKPLFISINTSIDRVGTVWLYCSASPSPTTIVSHFSAPAGYGMTFQHVVPPGFYYRIAPAGAEVMATGAGLTWYETTIDGGGGGGTAIGYNISGATAGSVLFAGTSGILNQDNANLFWDDSGNRLGIGESTPNQAKLHLRDDTDTSADTDLLLLKSVLNNGGTKSILWRDATNVVGRIGLKYDLTSKVDFVIEDLYNSGYQTATRLFTVKGSGEVGVGVTSPNHKVDVAGNVNVNTGSAYKVNGTDVLSGSTLGSGVTASSLTSVGTLTSLTVSGTVTPQARVLGASAAVTAANNLVLGAANLNVVSDATQINLIANTSWTAGSSVTLVFSGAPLVKHGQTTSGADTTILLAASTDFQAAANSVLGLIYDGTSWHETFRKVA